MTTATAAVLTKSAATHLGTAPQQLDAVGAHGTSDAYRWRSRSWYRVLINEYDEDSRRMIIENRLRLALRAPDGRTIPMHTGDLIAWATQFYKPVNPTKLSRSGRLQAFMFDERRRLPWPGGHVGTIPLKAGDWRMVASDGSEVLIPSAHTSPLRHLRFGVNKKGTVVAVLNGSEWVTTKNVPAAGGNQREDESKVSEGH